MACITKRRGRWILDFYDQHGKRRWKSMPKGSTKKQARDEMRVIEDQVAKRIFLPDKKVLLFSETAKEWLAYKKPKIRISTWEGYKQHIRTHFEELDTLRINRITIATIEKFITKRQNEKMNINTLRRILVTLNQIMNYAVRHRYIDHNPVREAERPKDQRDEGEFSKDKIKILTPSQITVFLYVVEDLKLRTLYRLAIFSGARQGELLGLKWSDVDWENNQIHIRRTFNHGHFFSPKSKSSNRKIDIGPAMMLELKKWKLACAKCEFDLVFPSNIGTPIDHLHMVSRYFHPTLKKANLPRIRFHDLRHTFASLLIEQGENIKYIQSQLGHASPTVTLDVYAHLMKPTNPESARKLENTVFGTTGSKMVAKTNDGEGDQKEGRGK